MKSKYHSNILQLIKEPKSEAPKSYRFSKRFKEFVMKDSIPGEGFNEKLAYIVYDYMLSEKDRKDSLKELERQIAEKEKQLETLSSKISLLLNVKSSIDDISSCFEDIKKEFKDIGASLEKYKTII